MKLEDIKLGEKYLIRKLLVTAKVIGLVDYLDKTDDEMNVSLDYEGLVIWVNSKELEI